MTNKQPYSANLERIPLGEIRSGPPVLTETDLSTVLEESLHSAHTYAASKNVSIQVADLSTYQRTILSRDFRRALSNIVFNAIDASKEESSIHILVDETRENSLGIEKKCIISIKDGGHGISEDLKPHVFSPGVSTKGRKGYGLTHAKKIIESDGAGIYLQSKEGLGTLVQVHVPINLTNKLGKIRKICFGNGSETEARASLIGLGFCCPHDSPLCTSSELGAFKKMNPEEKGRWVYDAPLDKVVSLLEHHCVCSYVHSVH